jgi:hypothetical protein
MRKKSPVLYEIYKMGEFPADVQPIMQTYIDSANRDPALQKFVAGIVAAGKKYGVHSRPESSAGWGVYNANAIPPNTKILVYQTTVSHPDTYTHRDTTFCFQTEFNPPGSGATIAAILDGAPGANAIKYGAPMTGAEKAISDVNGVLNNHSCLGWNISPAWAHFEKSGAWILYYKTHRSVVLAGSELLSNYNTGSTKGDKYFTPIDTLRKRGTPEEAIVKCRCKSSRTGKCPNNYAFDRDILEGRIIKRTPAGAE